MDSSTICFIFVLSGAELELSVFKNGFMVLIGVVYIVARSIGKYVGAFASAKFTKCDKVTCKYLGLTLLPQAGVALGMVNQVALLGINDATVIRNVVLFGVLIYELFGPALTRMSLEKAGEIKPQPKEAKDHYRFEYPQSFY